MNISLKKNLAEYLGTFALVFGGTGAVMVDALMPGNITHLGVALAFGLVVMSMIYALGEVSGAHFNPAVTIGFWLSGRFGGRSVVPYIVAQCLGAITASLLLYVMMPESKTMGETLPGGFVARAFVMEVVLSFFLMFVIINVSTGSREIGVMAGISIGATVALCATIGGPISGASMNPARSLGPALVAGNLSSLWLYIVAPVLGAGLAVAGCAGVKSKNCCPGPGRYCVPASNDTD